MPGFHFSPTIKMLKGKKRGLKRQSLLADLKTDPPNGILMSLRGDWIIVNKHKHKSRKL